MRGVASGARRRAAHVTAQVAGRPVGVILGHNTSMNPFTFRPAYRELDHLPPAERWARLRDPAVRAPHPRRAALRARARAAGAVHPLCRDALGPHVRDGRPARLRADRRTRASPRSPRAPTTTPDEIAYDYLTEATADGFPVLPGRRLCPRRPRADPRDAARPGNLARASATAARIAARSSMPALPTLHAGALGARPQPRAAAAAGTSGQDADQRDRRFLRLPRPRPARGRACAPMST